MKKKFWNPHQKEKRGLFHAILWMLGFYKDRPPFLPPSKDFAFPNPIAPYDASVATIRWVNHSTFLITVSELVFLTDPIWNERCSPFRSIGPKRHYSPPIALEEIPRLDFVLISHDHYDHLDFSTIQRLHARFPDLVWVMPLGVKAWFQKRFPALKKESLIELGWWKTMHFKKVSITSVPAQHFSGRGLFDRNRTLWMGFVVDVTEIQGKKRFYFAGDTGYNAADFKEIGTRFAPIDLSLLPIGSYAPRGFMKPLHINPEEAVFIHKEVGSRLSIGGHWGTFRLSEEPLDRPPYDLYLALQKEGISCEKFRILKPGQAINW